MLHPCFASLNLIELLAVYILVISFIIISIEVQNDNKKINRYNGFQRQNKKLCLKTMCDEKNDDNDDIHDIYGH